MTSTASSPPDEIEELRREIAEKEQRVEELEYLLWNPNRDRLPLRGDFRRPNRFWFWVSKLGAKRVSEIPAQSITAPVTADDDKTFVALKVNEDTVDATAATQAKNWLAGITALITLIATASVLSAPDVGDLSTQQVQGVVVTATCGFVLLALSLWFAYRAAYGTPGVVDKLRVVSPNGLRHYVNELRKVIAKQTYKRLRIAVVLAAIGVAFVLAANMITWLPIGKGGGAESTYLCVTMKVEGKPVEVMRTTEKNLPVSKSHADAQFLPC